MTTKTESPVRKVITDNSVEKLEVERDYDCIGLIHHTKGWIPGDWKSLRTIRLNTREAREIHDFIEEYLKCQG